MNNQANKLNNTAITHVDLAPNAHLNSSQSGSLNSSSILYLELQLANPELWNDHTHLYFLIWKSEYYYYEHQEHGNISYENDKFY